MIQFELFAAWGKSGRGAVRGRSVRQVVHLVYGGYCKELWLMALLIVADGVIIARRSGVERQVGWETELREQGVRQCEGGESGK